LIGLLSKCLEKLSNWAEIAEKVGQVANQSDDVEMEEIDAENVWKEGW
jgi:hypothetical protein